MMNIRFLLRNSTDSFLSVPMAIFYSWSGVRGITWSRVRFRVVAHCRVMVLAFAGS